MSKELIGLRERWKELISTYYNYDLPPEANLMNVGKVASDFDTLVVFTDQKPEKWMFVPCDKEGNVLEEPDFFDGSYDNNGYGDVDKYQYKLDLQQYQQAKERCLFEGFELVTTKIKNGFGEDITWIRHTTIGMNIHFGKGLIQLNGIEIKTLADLCNKGLILTPRGEKDSGL